MSHTNTLRGHRAKWEVDRANVEENIAEVLSDIREVMEIGEETMFVDLLMNNTRKEIVRVFFAILHLYARAYLDIWGDENGTIWVKLLEPPIEDGEELEVQMQLEL